jgi:hypothetical protein
MNWTPRMYFIDMDGTLSNGVAMTKEEVLEAEPVTEVANKVNELWLKHWIVIYTARRDDLVPATFEWLRRNNIRWHFFTNQKTPGGYYVDDKNLSIDDFVKEQL